MLKRILILLLLTTGAKAQNADPTPYLQVETGMHQATINRMVMLKAGSAIATVSDDKSARIWSAATLQPLGVIRPPIGPGDDGALDAVATTGNMLAVGGRIRYGDRFGIQFYRLSDLKLIGHRSELPAPVSALGFSAAGDTLAVGMVASRGLVFLDLRNGSQVAADPAYTGQVQWIDTAQDGRTVTSGQDGEIRLYAPNHTIITHATLPHGAHPYAVTFSPDGRTIAAGVQDSATVWLLDGSTLQRQTSLGGAPGRSGGFAIVAFTPDGQQLYAAGTYKAAPTAPRLIRRWILNTGQAMEFEAGTDTITDLLPTGPAILTSDAEPRLSRFDASGHQIATRTASHIDFRDAGLSGFALSADATQIDLPLGPGVPATVFDVRLRTLLPASSASPLTRPQDRAAGIQATQWRNSATPRVNGRPITLEQDERSLAAAAAPDGSGVAIGTNYYIRFVRRDGTAWQVLAAAPAWAVNVSANGSQVVAGLGDGTVRWFDAANGNPLLTLFLDPARQRWVLSTQEGFFDHDNAAPGEPDGRSLIGYRFNDPPAQISRFVETGQLYPIYYRPDLVGLALSNNPGARAAIQLAYARRGEVQTVLTRGLPPQLEIQQICGVTNLPPDGNCPAGPVLGPFRAGTAPPVRLETGEAAVFVKYRLGNPDGLPGSAVISRNSGHIAPPLVTVSDDTHTRVQTAVIPLGEGLNTIKLLPVSTNGEIEGSDQAAITFDVMRNAPAQVHRRRLFVLSVGITRYSLDLMGLPNARNDAVAVADLMRQPDPAIDDEAVVTTLYDDQATVPRITAAIQAIAQAAMPDDLVLIFFAGHGKDVDGHYYFAPADFTTHNPDLTRTWLSQDSDQALDQLFRKEGLGHEQLVSLLKNIKASRVAIVLDTCYSGAIASQDAVSQQDMNKTMARTLGHGAGRIVLSSATDEAQDQPANPALGARNGQGHGLFTGYLLDALEGAAANPDDEKIDVAELAKYTIRMVKRATAKTAQQQEPTFYFEGNDFFGLRTARPTALSSSQTH